jgi:hypothetical protein
MDNLRLLLLLLTKLPLPDLSLSLLSFSSYKLIHLARMPFSISVYVALVLVYGCEAVCGWERRWLLRGWVGRLRS